MNANGRRLDAWLIYKCVSCDKTWNLPLFERAAVSMIAETDLQAMHSSDPAWVRAREFDLAALRQHCERIDIPSDLRVTKGIESAWPKARSVAWLVLELQIITQHPTGWRLDRLLARELGFSRSELKAMQQSGGLRLTSAPVNMLKKPLRGNVTARFIASGLSEGQHAAVTRKVSDG